MVLPRARPTLGGLLPLATNVILGNKSSEHLEESTLQITILGTPTVSVFFTGKYHGGQDHAFQF
jgi:hypothetical protein